MKLKELTEDEKAAQAFDLVVKSIEDRDDIDFSFEADLKKMVKKISIPQLLKQNKKYFKKFSDTVMKLYLNVYLKEAIAAGQSQTKRFTEAFISG